MKKIIFVFLISLLFLTGCGKSDTKIPTVDDFEDKVNQTIEETKNNTASDVAYTVRKSAKLYYQLVLLETFDFEKIQIDFSNGSYSANNSKISMQELKTAGFELELIPSSGYIIISEKGEISGKIVVNGCTCEIPDIGEISCKG